MSAETLIRFFDAGPYECQIDDCTCPFGSLDWTTGTYPDGSEVLEIEFTCQWGHTTTLSLNQRKGEILYHVDVETDPEFAPEGSGAS